ncbi:MAG: hypothetical protein ACXIVQ_16755 [Acidimicrobiales bacterium]
MRVLVVEGAQGAAAEASEALGRAGHQAASCRANPDAVLCDGIVGDDCPIDHGVDAALLVRAAGAGAPTAAEDGVRCAIRHHIPVAVVGAATSNPYRGFAREIVDDADGDRRHVVAAVERAGRAALAAHTAAARAMLRSVLDQEGVEAPSADAAVVRHGDHLVVTLLPGTRLPDMVAETASVRALAAVRALDRETSIIDVTLA